MKTALPDIKHRLSRVLGLDPEAIGDRCILSSVHERMNACGITDEQQYADVIRTDADEMDNLIETVIIPETSFFRNRDPFDYLRLLISDPVFQTRHTPARILSVPCASGEEPYSIAMTFLDAGWNREAFQVVGMDVSRQQIAAAESGVYGRHAFREDNAPYRDTYFTHETEDRYRINDEVRASVTFRNENLLAYDKRTVRVPFDIIFCRNLLIYLHKEARRQVQQLLIDILRDDGCLFLGHAEMLTLGDSGLTPVDFKGSFCYCKHPATLREKTPKKTPAPARPPPPLYATREITREMAPRAVTPVSVTPDLTAPATGPTELTLENARHLADRGETAQATAICQALIEQGQRLPELYLLTGILYEQANRMQDAETHFSRALYLDNNCYEAMVHLSALKALQGDRVGASRLKQRAARVFGRIGMAQTNHTNGVAR
ncbi:MAG: hypothetical protein EOM20_18800 [Spartobacteria bacterium]|nr:hypothetical protein [Spartobacteria bacterium]